jgi:hypothetical protein
MSRGNLAGRFRALGFFALGTRLNFVDPHNRTRTSTLRKLVGFLVVEVMPEIRWDLAALRLAVIENPD